MARKCSYSKRDLQVACSKTKKKIESEKTFKDSLKVSSSYTTTKVNANEKNVSNNIIDKGIGEEK